MKYRKGQVVSIRFLDHCEDGSKPIEFIVYGRIGKVCKNCVCVDSWEYANTKQPYDTNEKRFTILRSAVLEVKRLVEDKS